MTGGEQERLAVLETKVGTIERDVTEIKSDVKDLVAGQRRQEIASATELAAVTAHRKGRGDTGVWVRTALPLGAAAGALLLGLWNALRGG